MWVVVLSVLVIVLASFCFSKAQSSHSNKASSTSARPVPMQGNDASSIQRTSTPASKSSSTTNYQFTLEKLKRFDGSSDNKVYVAVKGVVFDVSDSEFYRPGSSYHVFAGHDASVALALMSTDPSHLDCYDERKNQLNEKSNEVLNDWFNRFQKKYKQVGRLVSVTEVD